MSLFYRPTAPAALADVIPFFWNGEFHLFYLKDYRDRPAHGEGTPWFHIVTTDFLQYEDRGEAIPRGEAGSQDQWIFTGCVIEHAGTFHIFYTGHQDHYAHTPKPVECVMHATSPDLNTWTKDPTFRLFAPTESGYEKNDWRDPFVFWNDEAKEFWMLLAARRTTGPARERGCLALLASPDLASWTVKDPFWQPGLFYTHECPDVFQENGTWYLWSSVFSGATHTNVRFADSLAGPWRRPADEVLDGRPWYAAKTASDGEHRYGFGWLPSRDGEKDSGHWQWGGELVVHEISPRDGAPGSLDATLPASIRTAFTQPQTVTTEVRSGNWTSDTGAQTTDATGGHATLFLGALPDECLIETTVTYEDATSTPDFGLRLRWNEAADSYYELRFEPALSRIVFDGWPQTFTGNVILSQRPYPFRPGEELKIQLLLDGTCAVLYCNGRALSCRLYKQDSATLGLFAREGSVTFKEFKVLARP